MWKTVELIAWGAAILVFAWALSPNHRTAMSACEQNHSRDTCLYSLR